MRDLIHVHHFCHVQLPTLKHDLAMGVACLSVCHMLVMCDN